VGMSLVRIRLVRMRLVGFDCLLFALFSLVEIWVFMLLSLIQFQLYLLITTTHVSTPVLHYSMTPRL
jgi:hypothetical protein